MTPPNYFTSNPHPAAPGFTLVASLILLSLISLLAGYFIASAIADLEIASAYGATNQAYHLAEAGVAEMLAKLQSDANLSNAFFLNTLTPETTISSRTGVFVASDSYEVSAQSVENGVADITSTGTTPTKNGFATRVIRQRLGTATGTYAELPFTILSAGTGGQQNGDIEIRTPVSVSGSDFHSNHDIRIGQYGSLTVTDGDVRAGNNITIHPEGSLTVTNGITEEGVAAIAMPQVDFDSANSTSWKNRATEIMTPAQFDALAGGTILNGIIFVDGTPGILNRDLTVNGLLVIGGNFTLQAPGILTINADPEISGSGILVSGDLALESTAAIEGALFSASWLTVTKTSSSPSDMQITIVGGMVAWRIRTGNTGSGSPPTITITYDPTILSAPFGQSSGDAPRLLLDHWEEQY